MARNRADATSVTAEKHDYLFTWKPDRWPHSELRKLVDAFESRDVVQDWWRCLAHRKIRPGDRAYMLKQGKPIGIFGIGRVVGEPVKKAKASPGVNPWQVQLRFDASLGDILWDPEERLLVAERQLLELSAPKKRWQTQASGVELESDAAREIDNLVFDAVRVGQRSTAADEEAREVLRRMRLLEQATRPMQQAFRSEVRRNYGNRCAVTGCATPAAFEAAHISTRKGRDENSPTNGLLLRSDIHALFDRLLITLSSDGSRIEVSSELGDPTYDFLRTTAVTRPTKAPPSRENIQEHRDLFFERQKQRSVTPG